jgi:fructosamine-3-kinase
VCRKASQPTSIAYTLVLPWLLEGYQEVAPLPDGYRQRIAFASLLIAVRTLARAHQKRPPTLPTHYGLQAIPRDIHLLSAF